MAKRVLVSEGSVLFFFSFLVCGQGSFSFAKVLNVKLQDSQERFSVLCFLLIFSFFPLAVSFCKKHVSKYAALLI